jgi:hypothetical protein
LYTSANIDCSLLSLECGPERRISRLQALLGQRQLCAQHLQLSSVGVHARPLCLEHRLHALQQAHLLLQQRQLGLHVLRGEGAQGRALLLQLSVRCGPNSEGGRVGHIGRGAGPAQSLRLCVTR